MSRPGQRRLNRFIFATWSAPGVSKVFSQSGCICDIWSSVVGVEAVCYRCSTRRLAAHDERLHRTLRVFRAVIIGAFAQHAPVCAASAGCRKRFLDKSFDHGVQVSIMLKASVVVEILEIYELLPAGVLHR